MTLSRLLFAAMVLLSATAVAADRIVLLQVEVTRSTATLVSATVVDGHLKQPRHYEAAPGMLQIEVFDGEARRIHRRAAVDPTREILEWVDESGQLRSKVIEHDRAIAYIRLPYQQAASVVSVSRVMETREQNAAKQVAAQPLGSFNADWPEVANDE